MNAIIGHNGFIGSILKKDIVAENFNSKNIKDIENKKYDFIYCAGISSLKWKANKFPEEDKKNIDTLLKSLKNVDCNRLVLISTISIYDKIGRAHV